MNENTAATLMENPIVKEFIYVIRENSADAANVAAMLNAVSAIERYMEATNNELSAMRRDLADMREIQKHPIKNTLQNSIKTLQSKYNSGMERLGKIKTAIIEGCKKVLTAFKEKGKSVLNGIMKFFHVKDGLQNLKTDLTGGIREDNKSIAKIEAFSQQYHETGKSIGNIGRVLLGKETVQDAKSVGKLAHALETPYKNHRNVSIKICRAIKRAIGALDRLDHDVAIHKIERAAEKEEKRSLVGRLDENKERVARESLDRPIQSRVRTPQEATV